MNWKSIFTVYLKKLRDSLRHRRKLTWTTVISAILAAVMVFGMGKVRSMFVTTVREEVPVVTAAPWPLYGIGPLHFMFINASGWR